jgi:hypothetical protein
MCTLLAAYAGLLRRVGITITNMSIMGFNQQTLETGYISKKHGKPGRIPF